MIFLVIEKEIYPTDSVSQSKELYKKLIKNHSVTIYGAKDLSALLFLHPELKCKSVKL